MVAILFSNLLVHLNNGQGVEQNCGKAFSWYLKAAQQGDADGQYFVAACF